MAENFQTEKLAIKPLKVDYCGSCSLPFEYCCFGTPERKIQCEKYLENYSDANPESDIAISQLSLTESKKHSSADQNSIPPEEPSAQSKKKANKKKSSNEPMVKIGRVSRNRRKYITIVGGLSSFPDIKMKDAAKVMGKQFACGCSVSKTASGAEEITIQGDVLYDLPGFLQSSFKIPPDRIVLVGE
mmetsp:Transcript_6321/g.9462  ORF Transcript_6321/g.9462 Transcript_6321/m.9462 type:complete len:187 (+) Transcript_6321:35-595(+)